MVTTSRPVDDGAVHRGRRRAPAPFAALLLLWSASAPAQDDVSKARTQAHVDLGAEFFRAGRYEAAIEEFLKANKIISLPDYAYYIARCHEKLGHAGRALTYYESFLARAERDARDEDSARAKRALAAVKALRTGLEGTVLVRCQPPAGMVEVRGLGKGGCPFEKEGVSPGTYTVAVRAPGFLPGIEELHVVAGQRAETTVTLRRRPAPRPAAGDPPGGEVPSPGPEVATAPPTPPGPEAPPAEAPTPPPAAGSGLWPPPLWSLGSLGVGAGALGAGAVLGWMARNAELQLDDCIADDVPARCATSALVQSQLSDRAGRRALQANVAYAVGAVAVGVSVWLWVSAAMEEESTPAGEASRPAGEAPDQAPQEPQEPRHDGGSGALLLPLGVRWSF